MNTTTQSTAPANDPEPQTTDTPPTHVEQEAPAEPDAQVEPSTGVDSPHPNGGEDTNNGDNEDAAEEAEVIDPSTVPTNVNLDVNQPSSPRKPRKPRAAKKSATDPVPAPPAEALSDPQTVALTHTVDAAWVILREQNDLAERRAAQINEQATQLNERIEELSQALGALKEEFDAMAGTFDDRNRILESLTSTLVSLSGGKPGTFGKVRVTVIDGEARLDPS